MSRFFVILTLLQSSVLLAQNAPTTQPLSGPLGTPIQLFNGKDLTGWTWIAKPPKAGSTTAPATIDQIFSVKDGLLEDKGKPTGYIRTETDYDNYLLVVEQRHIAKGNGGVLFAMSGPDKIWPHCLEAQSQNGEEGDIRNIADFKMTMDPLRVQPKFLKSIEPRSEKPPGEWETYVIVVDHGNMSLEINGRLQNVATNAEGLAGKIGIQAEGGEIEYRKIELTPIMKP